MDNILNTFGGVPSQVGRNDDDLADRLSYRYTALIMVLFALITSTSRYVDNPINCWLPAHFTDSHSSYTNDYCWVKSTYYLDFDEYIPYEHEADKRYMISYYQWVPMILLLQALFFYMPVMFWRSMNSRSGLDVNEIVETAELLQGDSENAKVEHLDAISMQAKRYLTNITNYHTLINSNDNGQGLDKPTFFGIRTRSGHYLVFLYAITKLMYLANMFIQLYFMNLILGSGYHFYGFTVLAAIFRGDNWQMAERFPRATMCDLKVRRLGNIQRYTVQCVLPVNLFNEMIFLILWFWLFFVLLVSIFCIISWAAKLTSKNDDKRFIRKHLHYGNAKNYNSDERLEHFTNKCLRKDGVFVMRLIGINTDAVTVTEVINAIWDKYQDNFDDDNLSEASTSKID